jgi:hypothetical protein
MSVQEADPFSELITQRANANRISPAEQAVDDFEQTLRREANQLKARAGLFQAKQTLVNAIRDQEELEADLTLEPLLQDFITFAGAENWAGIYAKRREIVEHPLFFKSKAVRQRLSELDSGLKNYGTEYTTDGREVGFHDVMRMATSGTPEEQKEGLRVLALRSENAMEFLDSIPLRGDAARDPLFRYHLRTFVRENPRINPEDAALYNQEKQARIQAIQQMYAGSDPVVVNRVLASEEVQQGFRELRESLLYDKERRPIPWSPVSGSGDRKISEADFQLLRDSLSAEIEANARGFFGNLVSGTRRAFSPEQTRGTLDRQRRASAGLQAAQADLSQLPPAPPSPTMEPDRFGMGGFGSAGVGAAAAGTLAATGAKFGSVLGPKGVAVGTLAGGAAGLAVDMFGERGAATQVIEQEQARLQNNFDEVTFAQSRIASMIGNLDSLDENAFEFEFSRMMSALEDLNLQLQQNNLGYQISPLHLFSSRDFRIISDKLAAQKARQIVRSGAGAVGMPGLMGGMSSPMGGMSSPMGQAPAGMGGRSGSPLATLAGGGTSPGSL